MFDVASFLLRWMFLSKLCRDVADIQMLPICPPAAHSQRHHQHPPTIQQHPQHPAAPPPAAHHYQHQQDLNGQPQQLLHSQQRYQGQNPQYGMPNGHDENAIRHQPTEPRPLPSRDSPPSRERINNNVQKHDAQWKEQCLRAILSYPPGTQRTLVMDSLRQELVQELAHRLGQDQDLLLRHRTHQRLQDVAASASSEHNNLSHADDDDPYLDADLEIVHEFERQQEEQEHEKSSRHDKDAKRPTSQSSGRRASLVIGDHEVSEQQQVGDESSMKGNVDELAAAKTEGVQSRGRLDDDDIPPPPPPPEQVREARRSRKLLREYLPQLVSAVLKSPPAFHPELANPIQKLQNLILRKCLDDPDFGIDLCWLLEAEVGRAWKTLFEHRQQTGRRLIVVLPAEKAAVLAKIGNEKRQAFDLLQDAEQVTAYGYTSNVDGGDGDGASTDPPPTINYGVVPEFHHHHHHQHHFHTRLPSSLSLRRCSHFGDTMHFIDSLTNISSSLRRVPDDQRYAVLHNSLHELNRRIRRRMVTRGDISLDVEDHRNAHDWPRIDDMTLDMIPYSVHFPLVPQTGTWPNGGSNPLKKAKISSTRPQQRQVSDDSNSSWSDDDDSQHTEVVRVLNIVVEETKILASRERCPFLVHLEVSDSGLEGSDARLYTSGAPGLGSTVGEALGMRSGTTSSTWSQDAAQAFLMRDNTGGPSFGVPDELLHPANRRQYRQQTATILLDSKALRDVSNNQHQPGSTVKSAGVTRGGWQADGQQYIEDEGPFLDGHDVGDGYMTDPFDLIRQQQYEQLHQHLQLQKAAAAAASAAPPPPRLHGPPPKISLGEKLLDKVFGREWAEKVREIRMASPYGHLKGWRLASFIMKSGEDIRREAFVMQIISKLQGWFQTEIPEEFRPFMRPYTIKCVGADAGLLECLSDVKSIDEVKKRTDNFTSLRDYFERAFGLPKSKQNVYHDVSSHAVPPQTVGEDQDRVSFETAQDNFLRSLVGYSLVCYILQIKDRHNANILLDRVGHIMHIDFGYALGDTPKSHSLPLFSERAPFKLSGEFWEVLGGWNVDQGGLGVKFCKMFERAFECAAAHADEIATLAEATMLSLDSPPRTARATANGVRARLRMRGPPGSRVQQTFVMDLVNAALTSFHTPMYDWLQRNMHGYQ